MADPQDNGSTPVIPVPLSSGTTDQPNAPQQRNIPVQPAGIDFSHVQLVGQPTPLPPMSQPPKLVGNPMPLAISQAMDADKSIGPEERQFLLNNPTYTYLPKDPRFPNRQPGIYPTGPGNEWRTDPLSPNHDITQMPVDLHLLKHTLQYGGAAAAATAGPIAALEVLPAVAVTTIGGVKAIGAWAEAHPIQALALLELMKEFIPGAKKAIQLIKKAPDTSQLEPTHMFNPQTNQAEEIG